MASPFRRTYRTPSMKKISLPIISSPEETYDCELLWDEDVVECQKQYAKELLHFQLDAYQIWEDEDGELEYTFLRNLSALSQAGRIKQSKTIRGLKSSSLRRSNAVRSSKRIDKTDGRCLKSSMNSQTNNFLKVETPDDPSFFLRKRAIVCEEFASNETPVTLLNINENVNSINLNVEDCQMDVGKVSQGSFIQAETPAFVFTVDTPSIPENCTISPLQKVQQGDRLEIETSETETPMKRADVIFEKPLCENNRVEPAQNQTIQTNILNESRPKINNSLKVSASDPLTALLDHDQQDSKQDTQAFVFKNQLKKISPNDIAVKDLPSDLPKFGPPSSYRSFRGNQLNKVQSIDTPPEYSGDGLSAINKENCLTPSSLLRSNFQRNRPSSFSVFDKKSNNSLMSDRRFNYPLRKLPLGEDTISEVQNSSLNTSNQRDEFEISHRIEPIKSEKSEKSTFSNFSIGIAENSKEKKVKLLSNNNALECNHPDNSVGSKTSSETLSNVLSETPLNTPTIAPLKVSSEPLHKTLCIAPLQEASAPLPKTLFESLSTNTNVNPQGRSFETEPVKLTDQVETNSLINVSHKRVDDDLQKFGPPSSYSSVSGSRLGRFQSVDIPNNTPNSQLKNDIKLIETPSLKLIKKFSENRSASVSEKQYDPSVSSTYFGRNSSHNAYLSKDMPPLVTSTTDLVQVTSPKNPVQVTSAKNPVQVSPAVDSLNKNVEGSPTTFVRRGSQRAISSNLLSRLQNFEKPEVELKSTLRMNRESSQTSSEMLMKSENSITTSNEIKTRVSRETLIKTPNGAFPNETEIITPDEKLIRVSKETLMQRFDRNRPGSFSVRDKQFDISRNGRSSNYRVRPAFTSIDIIDDAPNTSSNNNVQNNRVDISGVSATSKYDSVINMDVNNVEIRKKRNFQPKYGLPSSYKRISGSGDSNEIANIEESNELKDRSSIHPVIGVENRSSRIDTLKAKFNKEIDRARPGSFSTRDVKYESSKFGPPSSHRSFRSNTENKSTSLNLTSFDVPISLSDNNEMNSVSVIQADAIKSPSDDSIKIIPSGFYDCEKPSDLLKFNRLPISYRLKRSGHVTRVASTDSPESKLSTPTDNDQNTDHFAVQTPEDKVISNFRRTRLNNFQSLDVQYRLPESSVQSNNGSVFNQKERTEFTRRANWNKPQKNFTNFQENDALDTNKTDMIQPTLVSPRNDLNNNFTKTSSVTNVRNDSSLSNYNRSEVGRSSLRSSSQDQSSSSFLPPDVHTYSSRTSLQLTKPEPVGGGSLLVKAAEAIVGTVRRKISIFNAQDLIRTQSVNEKRGEFGVNRARTIDQMQSYRVGGQSSNVQR